MADVLESDVIGTVLLELAVSVLDVTLASSGVLLGIHGLNRNDDGVEVLSDVEQVFLSAALNSAGALVILGSIDDEQF